MPSSTDSPFLSAQTSVERVGGSGVGYIHARGYGTLFMNQSRGGATSVAAYQDAIQKHLTQKSAAKEMGRCKKLPSSGVTLM